MESLNSKRGLFSKFKVCEGSSKWEKCISRELKDHKNLRSEFERDYNRILHTKAYRRLKHKTQVFFAPKNDHLCTRIEHVNLVASASYTISNYLGLNTELITAIANGHDIGHAPFGHEGEIHLRDLTKKYLKGQTFFHEGNSLRFLDNIETLESKNGEIKNLNLTYAVRDGIINHCGEVTENGLFPREEELDLKKIKQRNQYRPFTWEGCVVKISDKSAFLGRDIEDAIDVGILTLHELNVLSKLINIPAEKINNANILSIIIPDLCRNSSPENGLKFSKKTLELINNVYSFSKDKIYNNERLNIYKEFIKNIIYSIFNSLMEFYKGSKTINSINLKKRIYPKLLTEFYNWLEKYSVINGKLIREQKYKNKILYDIENKNTYTQAVIDYIAGMSDNFALTVFDELTTF